MLPNPASRGTYTCRIPPDSPAASCTGSPITEASLVVDDTQSENQALKDQNAVLMGQNTKMTDLLHSLEMARAADKTQMMQQISDLTHAVNGMKQHMNDAPYDTQDHFASMYLMIDDEIISYAYTKYDTFYEMGSCHAVVHLNKAVLVLFIF
nr:hypothetical protein BaRGS_000970 [Batillaria attramentaria]